MRALLSVAVVAALLALSGCGAFPSRVVMPPQAAASPSALAASATAYSELIKPVEEYVGVRPKEVEISRLKDQLTLYIGTWRKHSSDLLAGRDLSDNGIFWGTVGAGIQAVREKTQDARRAAAGVGLLALVQDKYKIEAQATNYKMAAQAMACIRREVEAIHPVAWAYFNIGTGKHLLESNGQPQDEVALAQIDLVFDDINRAMSDIQERLVTLQQSQRIGVPSVNDIKGIIDQAQKDAQAARSTASQSDPKMTATGARVRSAFPLTLPAAARVALLELRGKLTTCVGLFGSGT